MSAQTRGRVRTEPTAKRIRVQLGGVVVADSSDTVMVWENPYFPTYYFPPSDVRFDLLTDSGETKRSPSRGTASLSDVAVSDRTAERAAHVWNEAKIAEVSGYVSFDWASMDHWFEEDEEVFVHARDPYTRIDVLASSRSVRVEIDGVTVAESSRALFLFETGLPTRYYLPKTDVDFTVLSPTATTTSCPYKGTARYWSVTLNGATYDDVVWGYDAPLREAQAIGGYVAFYNEKLDIFIDGKLEDKPKTPFG